jgi:hypothetical protein
MCKYKGLGEEWQETVSFLPLASSRQFDTGYVDYWHNSGKSLPQTLLLKVIERLLVKQICTGRLLIWDIYWGVLRNRENSELAA